MHLRRGVVCAAVLLTACASAHTAGSSGSGQQRNVITADEIANSHERNAYELIEALRPSMLTNRGPTSISNPSDGGIAVFLDDQRFGDLSSLAQIPASDVREIRFLSAGEAQARWGAGYPSGVIQVVSKR